MNTADVDIIEARYRLRRIRRLRHLLNRCETTEQIQHYVDLANKYGMPESVITAALPILLLVNRILDSRIRA